MNSTEAESTRKYGGRSPEERRVDRRERLREAALDLVYDQGVAELTIGAVCTRASLAKRYFYENYASLEELLSSALQKVFDSISHAIEGSPTPAPPNPQQVLRVAVEAVLDAMDDPRAARLYLESAASRSLLATRDAAIDRYVDLLLGMIMTTPTDDVDAQLVAHLLVSGSTHVVAMWLRGTLPLERDAFVERLVSIGFTAVISLGQLDPPAASVG